MLTSILSTSISTVFDKIFILENQVSIWKEMLIVPFTKHHLPSKRLKKCQGNYILVIFIGVNSNFKGEIVVKCDLTSNIQY